MILINENIFLAMSITEHNTNKSDCRVVEYIDSSQGEKIFAKLFTSIFKNNF
jgi:hypothetical protein